MTAMREVRNPELGRTEPAVLPKRRVEVASLPVLVAKNLLFWGSISISFFGLYTIVSAL
ncbi:hypothetical protein [uncultured Roseibium sp.]|uniref:hypothetical protein n=1 Tax=uncultured Roseibium sp. TaxID=1936171 RepID=UPI0026195843|nr:hypothetical protein [uncultured Roseibium sp.]